MAGELCENIGMLSLSPKVAEQDSPPKSTSISSGGLDGTFIHVHFQGTASLFLFLSGAVSKVSANERRR